MSSPASGGLRRTRGHRLLVLAVAVVVVTVDQLTKTWALHLPDDMLVGGFAVPGRHVVGPLYFELTFNSGAAFGLGRGITPIVETVVVLLVVALLLVGRRTTLERSTGASLGLGLVVGGALGNLTDRLLRHHGGAVIDFVNIAQIGGHEYWPVFNVADSCIVVGAIVLGFRYARRSGRAEGDPSSPVDTRRYGPGA